MKKLIIPFVLVSSLSLAACGWDGVGGCGTGSCPTSYVSTVSTTCCATTTPTCGSSCGWNLGSCGSCGSRYYNSWY